MRPRYPQRHLSFRPLSLTPLQFLVKRRVMQLSVPVHHVPRFPRLPLLQVLSVPGQRVARRLWQPPYICSQCVFFRGGHWRRSNDDTYSHIHFRIQLGSCKNAESHLRFRQRVCTGHVTSFHLSITFAHTSHRCPSGCRQFRAIFTPQPRCQNGRFNRYGCSAHFPPRPHVRPQHIPHAE
jgi:hypothetical protein